MSLEEQRLESLKISLEKMLAEPVSKEELEFRNGDAFIDYEDITKAEIARVKQEIAILEPIVAEQRRVKDPNYMAGYSAQYSKKPAKEAFDEAKANYRKINPFIRAVNKVVGKSPNWNSIAHKLDMGEYDTPSEIRAAVRGGI